MPATRRIELDEVPPCFRPFAAPLLRQSDPGPALIRLLGTLGEKAPADAARDFALLLRRHLPRSARLDRVSDVYIRPKYPSWYIRAVNDRHRNAAYRRALEALVRPGMLVLEAGTGSGLFAMLAARAGAAHVHTCERDPHVARIARENLARNGLADRITLHECRYEELRVGEHLPRRADLFLHEFVAGQFVVKKMASMAAALCETLLVPGAPILPSRFAAVGMLVGDRRFLDAVRVPERVEGLDVSAVNLLAAAGVAHPGPVPVECPLSRPLVLAEFDMLGPGGLTDEVRTVAFEGTAEGAATGILQWVRHGFPDGTAYENRPELDCNWWPTFWPFPAEVAVAPGWEVPIRVETTETEVFVDPAG